jgi:hypothetical protein
MRGVLALAATFAGVAAATTRPPDPARCPIKASSASAQVQWAFTESGPPTYTHGRGSWLKGAAKGTICGAYISAGPRNIVLAVAGRSALRPQVRRLGQLGVELALPVSVLASDDAACEAGARGTVTLFASYHEIHRDRVQLAFASACTARNQTFTGSALHVLIGRGGHQVNST